MPARGLKLVAHPVVAHRSMSRPMRARGLKPLSCFDRGWSGSVAPLAGVWIETRIKVTYRHAAMVAPHAGAWIETLRSLRTPLIRWVAPHVGAWIETSASAAHLMPTKSRAPYGRVD